MDDKIEHLMKDICSFIEVILSQEKLFIDEVNPLFVSEESFLLLSIFLREF